MSAPSMRCDRCGGEMNHQADKLVHPVTAAEVAAITPALDGVIEAVFACPTCGFIDARRPDETPAPQR